MSADAAPVAIEQTPAPPKKKGPPKNPLTYDPRAEIVRAVHLPLVVGMSAPTIWRWRRDGEFPPAIQLGKNSIGWRRADLEIWLATRAR